MLEALAPVSAIVAEALRVAVVRQHANVDFLGVAASSRYFQLGKRDSRDGRVRRGLGPPMLPLEERN